MKLTLLSIAVSITGILSAQNIGINSTGATPNASAMLDIDAAPGNNKGLLIPRLALVATNNASPVTAPVTSLLVYNIATAGAGTTAVTPGYYYWDGVKWVRFQMSNAGSSSTSWDILGNAGTVAGTNFLGTTDNQDLIFKTNNIQAGLLNNASRNTSFGVGALNPLTTGIDNTANGASSLSRNTTGRFNTAGGVECLFNNTTGNNNTAYGTVALYFNTTGASNTASGIQSLYTNSSGNYNSAHGYQSLLQNTIGEKNTANGYISLYANTTGNNNTASGTEALYNTTTGNTNTALGNHSGFTNTIGSNNTFVGSFSDALKNNLTNATAIGYLSQVDTSNAVILGGNGANAVNVGIGVTKPKSMLHIQSGRANDGIYVFAPVGNGGEISFQDNTHFNWSNGRTINPVVSMPNYGIAVPSNTTGYGMSAETWLSGNGGIAFFTHANQRMLIDVDGKVGIGTNNPTSSLHVNQGNMKITNNFYSLLEQYTYSSAVDHPGVIGFKARGTEAAPSYPLNGDALAAFIGRDAIDGTLGANYGGADIYYYATENYSAANKGSRIVFNTTPNGFNNRYQRMVINHDGKVGINTNDPVVDLQVVGTIESSFRNAATTPAQAHYAQLSPDGALRLHRNLVAPTYTNSNGYIDFVNDLGTGYDFRISFERPIGPTGSLAFSDNINTFMTIAQGSGNVAMAGPNAVGYKLDVLGAMAANSAYIRSNAGIGMLPSAAYVLDVNGTVRGVGAFNTTSDRRKKQNIKSLTLNGLDVVKKLNPVSYDWITVLDDGMKGTQLGFIAQELEEVIPSIVVTANDEQKSKSVKYNELLPIYAKAIQEQQIQIEELKVKANKIENLEQQIEILKQQNEAILKLIEKK